MLFKTRDSQVSVGVTIAAKNDYCNSIDIARSTVAILLLLWTTIAIHLRLFKGENNEYGRTFLRARVPIFVWIREKFQNIVKVH